LLVIPNAFVFFMIFIFAWLVQVAAWFVILFTGKYPRQMFDLQVGCFRWGARLNAYANLWSDVYPPFTLR
jgi:hypothetical protein